MRTPLSREILDWIWIHNNFPPNPKAIEYLVDFFENTILLFPPKFEPDAERCVIELSKKYKLGIVSDTGFSPGKKMTQMMADKGILQYFSGLSYSDETGVAKPHPKAFQFLLDQFSIKATEALHIGDIESTDIKGAISVGMRAIRYDGGT
jgi:putative hydrolase of the HAD superfamily